MTGLHEEKAMRLVSPFPLDHARALPVSGEFHPLRRESSRWLSLGNAATVSLALLAGCAYLALKQEQQPVKPAPPEFVTICNWGLLPKPNSKISRVIETGGPMSRPKVGIPEPVPDAVVDVPTLPSPASLTDGLTPGGSGPIDIPEGPFSSGSTSVLPSPTEFVAYEQPPDLLRMQAPVYPPLAREANIEGTVLLRVLVSKEGKVLNAIVLSGNPMLVEAARTAAFTALFKPALQQHKPVPVWVQVPIVFSLN